jgi:hypothetical protein
VSLTRAERDALLRRHRDARAAHRTALVAHAEALDCPGEVIVDEQSPRFVDSPSFGQARAAYAELQSIEQAYFRRLPRVVMAPCPICGQPLQRSFDPFGLDGLWWRSDAQPEEPTPCPHFCVLQGAVRLEDEPPADFAVQPGPGAPFVLPRLLELPGMVAVVAELPVEGGTGYLIAYFAPRRPPAQQLAAGWGRTNFVYTTQLGQHGWRRPDGPEAWDFALTPWVERGQLRWCAPGSARTSLDAGAFPYADLPGSHLPQRLGRR